MYPASFNTYDSLAEAYRAQRKKGSGHRELQEIHRVNPGNTNGVQALKSCRAGP